MSTGAANARDVAAVDVDGDGDIDVVAGWPSPANLLSWHENLDGLGTAWATHTITSTPSFYVATADIDRDGDLDVLASDGSGVLRWFQNDADGTAWVARTIATAFVALPVQTADIDRDGDLDVVAEAGGPVWFENGAGGTTWTLHTVGNFGLTGVATADMDRDGDTDVVSGVGWYENGPFPAWTPHHFGIGAALEDPLPADVDGDGDMDVWGFAGGGAGAIVWYENLSGNGSAWLERTVATAAFPLATAVVDLDGDGDRDALSASGLGASAVVRHPNETIHRNACFAPPVNVSTFPEAAGAVVTADLDGDGDLDLGTSHALSNLVLWHENGSGAASWAPHTVATFPDRPFSLAVADVDRDGDADMIEDFRAAGLQLGTAWLENSGGGAAFTLHFIALSPTPYAGTLHAGDVDGDGDVDVGQAGYGLAGRWHGNAAGNGSTWAPPVVIGGTGMRLADIDGDGDLDSASTTSAFSYSHVGWRENLTGTGSAWGVHTISTAGLRPEVMDAADVDGDGDPDILQRSSDEPPQWRLNQGGGATWTSVPVPGVGGYGGTGDLDQDGDLDVAWSEGPSHIFGWHENLNGAGTTWQAHELPLPAGAAGGGRIAPADLDRDGDLDLVTNPAALVWHENRGGQFSLTATNQAPATANQGNLVSMLRADVIHLGRAGDGPLELARFGVLLEEAAGDPLTTAEANLLVESLRVYQDANPNGIFDPADVLAASVDTLSLTGGVQPVTFADGDANATVGAGASRTYFLVVELTAEAGIQNPNRLRATLLQLGPSASQAEHAAYDLPLAPACPADTPSGVVVATIPVELMGFTIE